MLNEYTYAYIYAHLGQSAPFRGALKPASLEDRLGRGRPGQVLPGIFCQVGQQRGYTRQHALHTKGRFHLVNACVLKQEAAVMM